MDNVQNKRFNLNSKLTFPFLLVQHGALEVIKTFCLVWNINKDYLYHNNIENEWQLYGKICVYGNKLSALLHSFGCSTKSTTTNVRTVQALYLSKNSSSDLQEKIAQVV